MEKLDDLVTNHLEERLLHPRPFAAIRKSQGLSRLKPIERLDTFAMIDLPPQAGIAPRVAVPLHRIAGNPAVSGE